MKINKEGIVRMVKTLCKEKKPLLIAAVGMLGILLVLLSEIGSSDSGKQEDIIQTDTKEYVQQLTQELTDIISKIDGVGRAKVMLTMDRYEENVYAVDSNEKIQRENNGETDSNTEYEYIIIKGNGTQETGLVRLTLEPKVRGVCVVCDGGADILVANAVTRSVGAVLGIGTDCISVTKMTDK